MILPYDASKEERDRLVKERQAKTVAAFDRMREMIDEQTATMNMSTVSEKVRRQQLEEIRNELQKSLGTFYSDLETGLKSDMESIGQSVLNESKGFYEALNMPIAMSITSFPVEVMTNIVNGSVYEQKWYLSQSLWGDYTDKLDDINEVITQGIGLNLSTYEIAKNLEKYVDPNARKEWEWSKVYPGTAKTVDYNAQRLARTLINHAYQQNVVQQAKANPFSKGVKWLASGGERMCDICAERDGKIFPADDVPLDHPNGMCTFEVVTEDLMTISNTLADFVNGEPTEYDDKLYAWYNDRAEVSIEKPLNRFLQIYNSEKVAGQIKETYGADGDEYWGAKATRERFEDIKKETGFDDEKAKQVLRYMCGDSDIYQKSDGLDEPECWFYHADTRIRNLDGDNWRAAANGIDDYIVAARKYSGEIYRGLLLSDDQIDEIVTGGGKFFEKGSLSSWSSSIDVAEGFAEGAAVSKYESFGMNSVVLRTVDHPYAVPVAHLSMFGNEEDEVLVSNMHGYEYSIANIAYDEDSAITYITLKFIGG